MIRWRVLNLVNKINDFDMNLLWREYTQKVTDYLYSCLINNDKNLERLATLNNEYSITITVKCLSKAFSKDFMVFEKLTKLGNEKLNSNQKLAYALKCFPERFIEYMYSSQKIIEKLPLTKKFNKAIKAVENVFGKNMVAMKNKQLDEDTLKKSKREYYRQLWQWSKTSVPGFKLMPLNEIRNHFIRIDQRTLKEMKIAIACPTAINKFEKVYDTVELQVSGYDFYAVKKELGSFFSASKKQVKEVDKCVCE